MTVVVSPFGSSSGLLTGSGLAIASAQSDSQGQLSSGSHGNAKVTLVQMLGLYGSGATSCVHFTCVALVIAFLARERFKTRLSSRHAMHTAVTGTERTVAL